MKRIIFIVIAAFLTAFALVPLDSSAEYQGTEQDELVGDVDDILSDYGIGYSYGDISGLGFGEVMGRVADTVRSELSAPLRMLGSLLVVAVFTALMRSAGGSFIRSEGTAGLYDTVCLLTGMTVIVPQLMTVYGRALTAIERMGGFISVFVPVFAAITAMSGGLASGGVYNVMVLAASEVFVQLSSQLLMPTVSVTTALAASASLYASSAAESISSLLKKVSVWGLTAAMTLFSGFVSLKCSIAAKADTAATKTAKLVISGAVPLVGGAVSDAYAAVRGSLGVMRATVGAAGTVAIILIMLPPVLEIMAFRLAMWTGAAAADMMSAGSVSRLIKGMDSGLAIAQSVLICYGVIFVICTGIMMNVVD